jgi:hypothetical protein
MFLLTILLVATLTTLLPAFVGLLGRLFPSLRIGRGSVWLPTMAGLLILISVFLPDVRISAETTTFQQHFLGGGVYAGCLYFYFRQVFGWKFNWFVELTLLFGWVSAAGVVSELAEFALTRMDLIHIATGDTDWDLLANTLGGLLAYIAAASARVFRR